MKLLKAISVLDTEYKIFQLESVEENKKELNSWEAGHCSGNCQNCAWNWRD